MEAEIGTAAELDQGPALLLPMWAYGHATRRRKPSFAQQVTNGDADPGRKPVVVRAEHDTDCAAAALSRRGDVRLLHDRCTGNRDGGYLVR